MSLLKGTNVAALYRLKRLKIGLVVLLLGTERFAAFSFRDNFTKPEKISLLCLICC